MKNRVDECDVAEKGCECEACTKKNNELGVVQVELTGAEVAVIGIAMGVDDAARRRIRAKMLAADNVFRARNAGVLRDGTKVDRLPVPPPGAPEFSYRVATDVLKAGQAVSTDDLKANAVPNQTKQRDPQAKKERQDIGISISPTDALAVAMSGITAPDSLRALLRPLLHKISRALRESGLDVPEFPEHAGR